MKHLLESLHWRYKFWFVAHEVQVKATAVAVTMYLLGLVGLGTLTEALPFPIGSILIAIYGYTFISRGAPAVYTYVKEHRRVKWNYGISEEFLILVAELKEGVRYR